jgi:hypothetical protein
VTAYCLNLAHAVDRVGATFDSDRSAGELNAWGNSYPAEELPFGGQVMVDSVRYVLVRKSPTALPQPDHVEALGQRLAGDPLGRPAEALALLAAGEMGSQELSVRVHLASSSGGDTGVDLGSENGPGIQVRSVTIPSWLIRPQVPTSADQLRCSHQHYPGDYDLALLVPVLWSRVLPLPGVAVTAIELVPNPLVHVFAITLLSEVGS